MRYTRNNSSELKVVDDICAAVLAQTTDITRRYRRHSEQASSFNVR